jgi:DNA processing protein
MGRDRQERVARAALSRLAEPGDVALYEAVVRHGAAQVLDAVLGDDAAGSADVRLPARRLAGYRARLPGAGLARVLDEAHRCGARLVCPGDAEWPTQVDQLGGVTSARGAPLVPPLCLWVRGAGDARLALVRSVAVIGARAATAYGEHVAGELGADLADRGWTVVSGAAYGVDAAAHRGALSVAGTTVAVLACGPDVVYPRSHDSLLGRVAEEGLIVSELAPGTSVSRLRLLQRNRLVAALTRGTVVVEAAVRSGTATTAGYAAGLGRPVMAVPGPVTSATSVGCHELVRSGRAVLVTDASDVVDAVGRVGEDAEPPRRGEERPEDALSGIELRALDALPVRRPAGIAALARTAGLDLASLRSALGALVAAGLAESESGGYRLSAAMRNRPRRA